MALATLRRARDVSADIGWQGVLRIGPRWLVCRRYLAIVAELRDLAPERARPREIRVTALDDAAVPAVSALDSAMTADEVARRLREGQRCTLGWWGCELAHYRWDCTGAVHLPYLGRALKPGQDDQVVVGIYTGPAFRGRGIAGAVMMDVIRRARGVGVGRLVWLAAWWNTRSLALTEQVASRVVGTVGYWVVGPCRRYFAAGEVRIGADGAVRIDVVSGGAR
ncbi:MAG TPA: GNAT family N-acetyltransferase [Methylomirabilota bacterium]|nr:GNAT family N-acetyltransferase [Methylomirabilota bacterium]